MRGQSDDGIVYPPHMIGMLNGIVDYIQGSSIIIDVNGVGYKTLVSNDVLTRTSVGAKVKLFIYTHVREDLLELYGFLDPHDLTLFEQLISVNGVGCKTALGVFSIGSRNEIIQAILSGDVAYFTGVPRLGKKGAQKIIIDLKNKLGSTNDLVMDGREGEETNEVIAALEAIGYSSTEAYKAVRSLEGKGGTTTAEKVRLALKYLGK